MWAQWVGKFWLWMVLWSRWVSAQPTQRQSGNRHSQRFGPEMSQSLHLTYRSSRVISASTKARSPRLARCGQFLTTNGIFAPLSREESRRPLLSTFSLYPCERDTYDDRPVSDLLACSRDCRPDYASPMTACSVIVANAAAPLSMLIIVERVELSLRPLLPNLIGTCPGLLIDPLASVIHENDCHWRTGCTYLCVNEPLRGLARRICAENVFLYGELN